MNSTSTTTAEDSPNERYNPPPQTGNVVAGDFRPRVILPGDGRLLDDFVKDLVGHLKDKPIFNHGGLVTVIDKRTNKLRQIGQSAFRSWLEDPKLGNVVCQGRVGSGKDAFMQDRTMSEEIAKGVLASHRFLSGIREISRVNMVRLPIRRENGEIELLPEGYDADSKIFTNKALDFDENVELDSAKPSLEALLSETAFNPADKLRSTSAMIAMMQAPFCDCLFDRFEERPSFIVQANQEGAGKTTAIRIAIAPVFGPVQITTPPEKRSEGELKKLLDSIAQAGAPYLFLDNWVGKIESAALAAFITANALSARVLGTSHMFDAEKHCLVFISGNQASVTGEMRRRSIFIDLFIEEAKAEDHKRSRQVNEKTILERRSEILSWLWAFVRNWRDGGCKPGTVHNASFEEWGKTIGGILEHAGYPSPLLPPPTLADEELLSFSDFVEAIAKQHIDGSELKFEKLLGIARAAECFEFIEKDEPTGDDASKRLAKERSTLGKQLRKFAGRTFTLPNGTKINFSLLGRGHSREYKFLPKE